MYLIPSSNMLNKNMTKYKEFNELMIEKDLIKNSCNTRT